MSRFRSQQSGGDEGDADLLKDATWLYSYADLSANFEGMRFWLRVLGTERDPLDKGYFFNRPYVSCARRVLWFGERRWRVKRHVRLADYVTAGIGMGDYVQAPALGEAELPGYVAASGIEPYMSSGSLGAGPGHGTLKDMYYGV